MRLLSSYAGETMKRIKYFIHWIIVSLRIAKYGLIENLIISMRYKTNLVISLSNIVVGILTYAFLGSSIVYQKGIETYGTHSPEAFLLSGYIALFLLSPLEGHLTFSASYYELLLTSPTPLWCNFLARIIWAYVRTLRNTAIVVTTMYFFGITFKVDPLSLVYVIVFSTILGIGLGILNTGINFIVKRGQPIHWILRVLESLASGRWIPLNILPWYVQHIAWILPSTPLNFCLRVSIFASASIVDFPLEFLTLAIISVTYFLIGYIAFKYGIEKIRNEGLLL